MIQERIGIVTQPLYRRFSELSLSHPFPAYDVKAAGQSKGDDLKAAVPRVRGETLFSLFIGDGASSSFTGRGVGAF